MLLNLATPLDRERFRTTSNKMFSDGKESTKPFWVDLTRKRPRSLKQNAYLHLLLAACAMYTGYTIEQFKDEFYKREINPEIFREEKVNKITNRTKVVYRSSKLLTTKEMSTSIERLKDYAAQSMGIYLPPAENKEELHALEIEAKKHEQYL